MSEDAPVEEIEEKTEDVASESTAGGTASNDAARNKYRLITGEEILENGEARPSTLAFLGMYILGALVFGVHMLFHNGLNPADDASFLLKLTATLIDLTDSETVPIGFVMVMGFLTWANRMLNISTSGRWVTIALMLATLLPVIITLDDLVSMIAGMFGAEDGAYDYIPFGYNYFWAGLAFTLTFWAATFKYQRSFSYAVTTNAIIFHHAFLLSRSHRRILFDRISEVMVERSPMGTMLGYATVTIMTDSGVGLMEETVGVSAGTKPSSSSNDGDDSAAAMVRKGLFKSFFAFLSYQRTTRRVDHDPRHCFYKIRKWEDIKMMLNEMHRKHSQSNMLEDIKAALTKSPDGEA
jgi:membrane protein YdbS with pleckstrin-like domain